MLAVRRFVQSDLTPLFSFWYDLEVLRAGLFSSPAPAYDLDVWIQRCAELEGFVVVDGDILGALLFHMEPPCAIVDELVVDIHASHSRALASPLWQAAVETWINGGCCCVRAAAQRRLPVEKAFWQACGANVDGKEYWVRLC